MTPFERLNRPTPVILAIDADLAAQSTLSAHLEQEPYDVVFACSGQDGLALYQRYRPDIVLLNGFLPDMSGVECCAHLAGLTRPSHVPILVIAEPDDHELIDRAFEVGATDYIPRPIHWVVLRYRLKRLLLSSHAMMQLELANQELSLIAAQDGLTFVANRRCFDASIDREWRRMAREQSYISLILCDIDFFKAYNDAYGHQAGDRCLKQVANILAKAVRRPADLVARYGGEEFAILLPKTDYRGATRIAREVQANLRQTALPHIASKIGPYLTVSMGIASTVPLPNSTSDALIDAADKALYQAKSKGRNCTYLSMMDTVCAT